MELRQHYLNSIAHEIFQVLGKDDETPSVRDQSREGWISRRDGRVSFPSTRKEVIAINPRSVPRTVGPANGHRV